MLPNYPPKVFTYLDSQKQDMKAPMYPSILLLKLDFKKKIHIKALPVFCEKILFQRFNCYFFDYW